MADTYGKRGRVQKFEYSRRFEKESCMIELDNSYSKQFIICIILTSQPGQIFVPVILLCLPCDSIVTLNEIVHDIFSLY